MIKMFILIIRERCVSGDEQINKVITRDFVIYAVADSIVQVTKSVGSDTICMYMYICMCVKEVCSLQSKCL